MTERRAGLAFFERAVTLHRADCAALDAAPRFAADGFGPAERMAAEARLSAYAAAAEPVFDACRRLIGQLAGLLILVRASGRREVLDLPDLPIAEERWRAAGERLAGLAAPGGLAAHRARLEAAWRLIGEGLASIRRFGERAGGEAAIDRAADEIAAAYRALKTASDAEAGLAMVDLRQACCACMVQPAGARETTRRE
ncbi:hypothetical protein [Prosthecomicrobium pneumaticum]|uniref:Uncharacterized protein n=1 Tax=Prosthecomicrobium pneumaticum TaxID=81895 RepID=A0A7W9FMK1_9HYPH|nr:hypothetical protein [Prosthecomicrobium pneumaticum]MBB5753437.1 hypothetical protein [Prosthecomicrobium pneumaticum]